MRLDKAKKNRNQKWRYTAQNIPGPTLEKICRVVQRRKDNGSYMDSPHTILKNTANNVN